MRKISKIKEHARKNGEASGFSEIAELKDRLREVNKNKKTTHRQMVRIEVSVIVLITKKF